MSNRLRTAVIIVVTAVWAANLLAPIVVHDFRPPPEINGAFMAIVAMIAASYERGGGRRDK